jgi:TRAP-type uncharacterized transport system fused permease subunit
MFVYEPALLMIGDWPTIARSSVTASIGIILFAGGLHGYFITAASPWQRGFLLVAGLLLIDPGLVTDIIGAVLALAVVTVQVLSRREASAGASKAPVKQAPS